MTTSSTAPRDALDILAECLPMNNRMHIENVEAYRPLWEELPDDSPMRIGYRFQAQDVINKMMVLGCVIERTVDLDRMRGWIAELRKENASLKAINGSLQKSVVKLAGGIERERMACAFVVFHVCFEPPDGGCPSESERLLCERIAAAIRARSGIEGEKKDDAP